MSDPMYLKSIQDPRGFWELGTIGVSRAAFKDELLRRMRPVTLSPIEGLSVTRLDPPTGA